MAKKKKTTKKKKVEVVKPKDQFLADKAWSK